MDSPPRSRLPTPVSPSPFTCIPIPRAAGSTTVPVPCLRRGASHASPLKRALQSALVRVPFGSSACALYRFLGAPQVSTAAARRVQRVCPRSRSARALVTGRHARQRLIFVHPVPSWGAAGGTAGAASPRFEPGPARPEPAAAAPESPDLRGPRLSGCARRGRRASADKGATHVCVARRRVRAGLRRGRCRTPV